MITRQEAQKKLDGLIGEKAMNDDAALTKVEAFLREHGYKGELRGCLIERRGEYTDVFLLRPYGLFIIRPDGSVEDNYEVFTKRKGN